MQASPCASLCMPASCLQQHLKHRALMLADRLTDWALPPPSVCGAAQRAVYHLLLLLLLPCVVR